MHSAQEVKSDFTKRYVIAISLIALLSTAAFFFLHLALKTSDSTALIVNMSGKQRMLSQRVASLSQQYYARVYAAQGPLEAQLIRTNLLAAITEMEAANTALSTGRLNDTVRVELSAAIRDLYFGQTDLKDRVEEYLLKARRLAATPSPSEAGSLHREIIEISNPILIDLNHAVLQYQQEGEENIARVQRTETVVWIVTLITLLLEVIFIFQPMASKIRELFQEVTWNQQNLEQQIALRTIHLEEANQKLQHVASHDPLTGLKNRLNMERDLEELLHQYEKNRQPFAVVMLDIDWFKKVNDLYGHDAGDFVLIEFAKILLGEVRVQDSVYRAGGEEFVIVFNRISKEQVGDRVARLLVSVEEYPFVYNDITIRTTVSAGIFHPENTCAENVQEVLKCADGALYEAKRAGRNRMAFFICPNRSENG